MKRNLVVILVSLISLPLLACGDSTDWVERELIGTASDRWYLAPKSDRSDRDLAEILTTLYFDVGEECKGAMDRWGAWRFMDMDDQRQSMAAYKIDMRCWTDWYTNESPCRDGAGIEECLAYSNRYEAPWLR